VIAADLGGLAELVRDGVDGIQFRAGETGALASAVQRLWHAPELRTALRAATRRRFEAEYSPRAGIASLRSIYRDLTTMTSRRSQPA